MRIQWIGQSATAKSSNVSNLVCTNLYPEAVESRQGKTVVALYSTPGLRSFVDLPGQYGVRALHVTADGRLFAVRGNTFTEVWQDGTRLIKGTLDAAAGPISLADNGLVLFVVTGGAGYTYTYATDTFAQITDPDFLGASHTAFLDGYILFLRPFTQQFYWTDLLATTIDPLNIASAEGNPDILVAMLVAHREIWLFGRRTTEIWYSTGLTGAAGAEFARLQGALLEHGCLAPHSPAVVGEQVCWLSHNGQGQGVVLEAVGATPRRISTHTLEQTIARYDRLDDAVGWGYQDGGHSFYWLCFPSADATWVYDGATGLWHQRSSYNTLTGMPGRHVGYCHAFAHGRHYIGSGLDGKVYILDDTVYTDAGAVVVREAVLPPVSDPEGFTALIHDALYLDCETGVGLDGGVRPGHHPTLLVSYSDDGGHTWTAGQHVPLGALGDYRTQVCLRRLGCKPDRRYRLRMSDPCKLVILGAGVDIRGTVS